MGFNFPLSPAIGTLHPATAIAGAPQYVWDGQVWKVTTSFASPLYVLKAGDTMSGNLIVSCSGSQITLNGTDVANSTLIQSRIGTSPGTARWNLYLGDGTAESGSNAGSNLVISRCNDAGTVIDQPLKITRSSGAVTMRTVEAGAGAQSTVGASISVSYDPTVIVGIAVRPTTNTGAVAISFKNAADTTCGNITNTASATAYNTSSDASLKEDLKSFDAGNIIDNTHVYDFAWKSTKERAFGVIAQQAVDVYPMAVTHTEASIEKGAERDEWWGVDYSKYVPVLLQELKTLRARVAQLEAAIVSKPART